MRPTGPVKDVEIPLVEEKTPGRRVTKVEGKVLQQKRRSWLEQCCPILTTA